ncbi:MAG: hypothetical protein WB992_09365 [Bryobacteraceae bacterium]
MGTQLNPNQVKGLPEFIEEVRLRLKTLELVAQKIAPEEFRQAKEQTESQGHIANAAG